MAHPEHLGEVAGGLDLRQSMEVGGEIEKCGSTALIDGVRKFAMDARELDIDLIDRINPFGEA